MNNQNPCDTAWAELDVERSKGSASGFSKFLSSTARLRRIATRVGCSSFRWRTHERRLEPHGWRIIAQQFTSGTLPLVLELNPE